MLTAVAVEIEAEREIDEEGDIDAAEGVTNKAQSGNIDVHQKIKKPSWPTIRHKGFPMNAMEWRSFSSEDRVGKRQNVYTGWERSLTGTG